MSDRAIPPSSDPDFDPNVVDVSDHGHAARGEAILRGHGTSDHRQYADAIYDLRKEAVAWRTERDVALARVAELEALKLKHEALVANVQALLAAGSL